MTAVLSRVSAATAAAAAVAQRDAIKANLLELDASFGRRLLAGAALTGHSRQRWASAQADLSAVWETFGAYSAVIDRAAELAGGLRHSRAAGLAELSGLLSGTPVRLARPAGAPVTPDLTAAATTDLTLAGAVAAMKRSYAAVAVLCAEAEAVWTEVSDAVAQAGEELERAAGQARGLHDASLDSALTEARQQLGALREQLNADPLSLGPAGDAASPGATAVASLRRQVALAASRAAELAGLREHGAHRITAARQAAAALTGAWQQAAGARGHAAVRISGAETAPLPAPGELAGRLAAVSQLHADGQWTQLASELTALERDITAAGRRYAAAEADAAALLAQRDSLRGLLGAYQAKAAALGGAENTALAQLHGQARRALWTAPCDLTAAAAAVTSYQQAVLALTPTGGQP